MQEFEENRSNIRAYVEEKKEEIARLQEERKAFYNKYSGYISFLPENFRDINSVRDMRYALGAGLVDTLKEALNYSVAERRRYFEEMERQNQRELDDLKHKEKMKKLDEISKLQRQANSELQRGNDILESDYKRKYYYN